MNNTENFYACINGKKYVFDFDKLKSLVANNDSNQGDDEITESYGLNDSNEMKLSARIFRKYKSQNYKNNLIVYECVQGFLNKILDTGYDEIDENGATSLGLSLSINTLISYGLLKEIN